MRGAKNILRRLKKLWRELYA